MNFIQSINKDYLLFCYARFVQFVILSVNRDIQDLGYDKSIAIVYI